MSRTFSSDQPDLVLISWSRRFSGSRRRIVETRVIGTAFPCRFTLTPGSLLRDALNCLLDNDVGDFRVVFRKRTSSLSGYIVLQRFR
ncbi:hypothetical protein [Paenibacillus montanisoli]|uniref:Uncharacterized protein n=1 Tax=Paenibacillus montanisoli TaxID=2081970 RepID=A0A328TZU4_9BACL|nr:hypothetical protein [Paenibacillus montanisoli]RAP75959.1 hypothetical protein DL346_11060 [Paenibacillus montanisoli]